MINKSKENMNRILLPHSSFTVTCKNLFKNQKKFIVTGLKCVVDEDRELVFDYDVDRMSYLAQNDSNKFLKCLVENDLADQKINDFWDGEEVVKDYSNQRFIRVRSDGYSLYFNELAISKYKGLILKLDERSKKDIFDLISDDIVSKRARHMRIILDDKSSKKEFHRAMRFIGNENNFFASDYCTHYIIRTDVKDNIQNDEFDSMYKLIDKFVGVNGLFNDCVYNESTLIAHNKGSLKIEGIDVNSNFVNKVLAKTKR